MPSQSIEWLYEDEIWEAISSLKEQYENDPICIINFNPIGYILKLECISYFFEDDLILLASVIIRSIIQGHPLQDGNKRLGMFLGTYFLEKNGILITATDEAFFEMAMGMACGNVHIEQLYHWLKITSVDE